MIQNREDVSQFSDKKLVELSKEDPENFGFLIERYQERLFAFVKRISYLTPQDIEDVLQDSFIKVYQNLNGFDSSMKFSTWIYQITRNTAFDAIRRQNARPKSASLEQSELETIFRSSINLHREVLQKDKLEKVRKIIQKMPLEYREVFVLRFLEERSYEEIMDIVKKPKGTVASLINRGRKMLKEEAERLSL